MEFLNGNPLAAKTHDDKDLDLMQVNKEEMVTIGQKSTILV